MAANKFANFPAQKMLWKLRAQYLSLKSPKIKKLLYKAIKCLKNTSSHNCEIELCDINKHCEITRIKNTESFKFISKIWTDSDIH